MEPLGLNFQDATTGEEAYAAVRAAEGCIALALSLKSDGDVEVVLPVEVCRALATALTESADIAKPS